MNETRDATVSFDKLLTDQSALPEFIRELEG